MARIDNLNNYLEDVASAIKTKKGDNAPINASEFDTEIINLPSGGGDLSEYFTDDIKYFDSNYGGWMLCVKKLPPLFFNGVKADYLFSKYCGEVIDFSNIDLSNATSCYNIFSSSIIKSIDLSNFNANKTTNFGYIFCNCKFLKEINFNNYYLENGTIFSFAFYGCGNLETLNLTNIDMAKVVEINGCTNASSKLKNIIGGFKNLGKGYTSKTNNYVNYALYFVGNQLLTHDSLIDIINNLYDLNLTYDVANGGKLYTQTLNLGVVNKAKLTPEEIAIATNKGWTVS